MGKGIHVRQGEGKKKCQILTAAQQNVGKIHTAESLSVLPEPAYLLILYFCFPEL